MKRFDIVIKLLGGELKDLENKISDKEVKDALSDFAIYKVCLMAVMIVPGRICKQILIWTCWHAKYPVLNLYNKWWYLFNAYYNEIEGPDLIFIDVVLDTKESVMIYSGYLANFDFTNGELERVYLKDTLRRNFDVGALQGDNEENITPSDPYAIPGDIFSIAYKTILNINTYFITLDNSLQDIEQLPNVENE